MKDNFQEECKVLHIDELEKVIDKAIDKFNRTHPEYFKEWLNWTRKNGACSWCKQPLDDRLIKFCVGCKYKL